MKAKLLTAGKTATGIHVPDEVVEKLGGSKRPAVRVTIPGYTYRTSIASMGGKFMLPVSAEHRAGAGAAAGEEGEGTGELDTEPREVPVPPDLATAREADAEARRYFEGLAYS